jgi:hypothetical protein
MAKSGYRKPAGFKQKDPSVWKIPKRKNTSNLPSRLKDNVWRKPPKPESTTD